jgi:hypothetical protein
MKRLVMFSSHSSTFLTVILNNPSPKKIHDSIREISIQNKNAGDIFILKHTHIS